MREYANQLKAIDERIALAKADDIPALFKDIPLDVFGELSLQEQSKYKRIREFFPLMPSAEIQDRLTGKHGKPLLEQSLAFIGSMLEFYLHRTGNADLSRINVLDFGCGWGRLIRLLYKYVPESNIYAVDAWESSLQTSQDCKVRAHFAKIDDICTAIPFDAKFDLIYAFSVFTHLSKPAGEAALKALRSCVKENGLVVLTIRNYEFWRLRARTNKEVDADKMIGQHIQQGFAFVPQKKRSECGESTFGVTSISLEYVRSEWTGWKLIDYKINLEDPYQTILFLQPA